MMQFEHTDLHRLLDDATEAELEASPFGVIRLDRAQLVTFYNAAESEWSGLRPVNTIGKHFFKQVALCMNNALVAQRYEQEPELDVIISYVLALRMKSTPVRLRLLQTAHSKHAYLVVQR